MTVTRILRHVLGATIVASLSLTAAPALSQAYPDTSRALTVISNLGGALDMPVRLVLEKIKENTGMSYVLEPRPGANGALGLTAVRNARPDGYTLAWTYASAMTLNPFMTKGLQFEAKDFTPVSTMVQIGSVIAVKGDSPANTLKDLIDTARQKPESVKIGYSGAGTMAALLTLQDKANVKFLLVPYKSNAEGVAGTLGGVTDAHVDVIATILAQAGRLKAVSFGASPRSPRLPNVPSVREIVPGVDMTAWFGIVGPAGMPNEAVTWLNREIVRALRDPQVAESISKAGFDPVGNTPAEMGAVIRTEVETNRATAIKFKLGG